MTQSLVYKLRIDVQSQNLFFDNPIIAFYEGNAY